MLHFHIQNHLIYSVTGTLYNNFIISVSDDFCFGRWLYNIIFINLLWKENNRALQMQQEDSDKEKIIDIPSPELLDFKVKAADFKTFTKVRTYMTVWLSLL